jgi:hypothetical protein
VDDTTRQFMTTFQTFLDDLMAQARGGGRPGGRSIVAEIEAHLDVDPRGLPIVVEEVAPYQLVSIDVAVERLLARHGGGRVIGIGGGERRLHHSFGELLEIGHRAGFTVTAADYANLPIGPDATRQTVSFGVHLFHYEGEPVAALQRGAASQAMRRSAALEVVAAPEVAGRMLAELRELMVELSVFRAQVLTLGAPDEPWARGIGGITFQPRPALDRADVILPPGVLDRVERHIGGGARHRAALLAAGQHLKRGLLLYGPPGTGKTHTVRFLASALPEATVIVLTGLSMKLVGPAIELARALQPSIVVLEDVDLIAGHREQGEGSQPLLFEVLEGMDGLATDADVAFVLTTNRPDLLEPALAQRPGRIDLAVEVPLPDVEARRALLRLYARDVAFSPAALDAAADRTAGTSASFAKELVRRALLDAAETGRLPGDADLSGALDALLDESQRLTRVLLGSPNVQG